MPWASTCSEVAAVATSKSFRTLALAFCCVGEMLDCIAAELVAALLALFSQAIRLPSDG